MPIFESEGIDLILITPEYFRCGTDKVCVSLTICFLKCIIPTSDAVRSRGFIFKMHDHISFNLKDNAQWLDVSEYL